MVEMIALKNLSKHFGSLPAVDSISLTVPRGEVLGFLGPNGAGKSTTMKMIAGFLEPTSGSACVCGLDVGEHPVEAKRRIGYLPEGAPTYGDMTARRFLNFIAEIRGFDGAEKKFRIEEVVEKVAIGEVMDQLIETLSKGFKRRVGLAQAMLHDPEILVLDEPTDGLDPNQKHHVRGLIRDMAKDKAIIVSTHILEEVEAVCTRAVIIAQGRLLVDGAPEELVARAANHNAVLVSVDAAAEQAVVGVANAMAAVRCVEILDGAGGVRRVRVLPLDGQTIVGDLGEALRAANTPVREIFVERGALDDVFRTITSGPGSEPNKYA